MKATLKCIEAAAKCYTDLSRFLVLMACAEVILWRYFNFTIFTGKYLWCDLFSIKLSAGSVRESIVNKVVGWESASFLEKDSGVTVNNYSPKKLLPEY